MADKCDEYTEDTIIGMAKAILDKITGLESSAAVDIRAYILECEIMPMIYNMYSVIDYRKPGVAVEASIKSFGIAIKWALGAFISASPDKKAMSAAIRANGDYDSLKRHNFTVGLIGNK